jgi:ABC-type sugar transport system ATPase subunit
LAERRFEDLRWPADDPIVDIPELSVQFGERLIIFGPNGAGKTTLLRLIAAVEGEGGTPYASYLPQRPYLFRGTCRANLYLGLDTAARARAEDLAERLGVADRLGDQAKTLSGGERMRLSLARTLAVDSPLALLDEPLAPLDLRDRESVGAVIAEALSGRTGIIVTHDRDTAAMLGDRLAIMIGGKILQIGPVAEVLATPSNDTVAEIVGVSNVIDGRVVARRGALVEVEWGDHRFHALGDHAPGTPVKILFGGEAVGVHTGPMIGSSLRNLFPGEVIEVRAVGRLAEVVIDCGSPVVALLTPGSLDTLDIAPGSAVQVSVKATAARAVAVGGAE